MLTKFLRAAMLVPLLLYSHFSQSQESAEAPLIVCPVGEFSGSYYTPAPQHILDRLSMRSTNSPCADIEVTYNNFPEGAQEAFQAAVDIWAYSLSSSVTIRITANWTFLSAGLLGSAGSNYVYRNFSNAPDNRFYSSALADQIAGYDLNAGQPDIIANFNSIQNWYFGTDGGGTYSQYDLVSVVLHELGHGFGFASSFNVSGGSGSFGVGSNDIPMVYDDLLVLGQNGSQLLSLGEGTSLGNALTGNNVYCNGDHCTEANDGVSPRIYAPVSFNSSSSLSHLNEWTYLSGSINSLMTPSMGPSEAIHNPGPIALGILQDLGWTLCDGGVETEPCTAWTKPTSNTGSEIFNNTFNGAPCDYGSGCPTFQITSQVTAGTAYEIDNFHQGGVYSFSICEGPNAGSWIPEFTIIAPNGGVDAFGEGTDGCSITWTASQTGTYIIVVNEANQCGESNSTLNGYPALNCQDGTATCSPSSCAIGILILEGDESLCPDNTSTIAVSNAPSIPYGGGIGLRFFSDLTDAEVLVHDVTLPFTFDNSLNGLLPLNGITTMVGEYQVSGFVYSEAENFANSICGNSPQSITINFLTEIDTECGGDPCLADLESPIASCTNVSVSLNSSGVKDITPSLINLGSTDNCPGLSFQLSKTHFTCADIGLNSVILTVTDLAGNTDYCVSNVTVVDGISPSLTAPSNRTVSADIGNCAVSDVSLGTPVFSDNCSVSVSNNAPDIFPVGVTAVVWTATDGSGNSISRTQYVTVLENESLDLTISLSGSSTLCEGESVTLSATDGFEEYLWSTGETSPEITVNSPGLYFVEAIASNECSVVLLEGVEIIVLPDADGDGTCDVDDGCPNDPDKILPGSCGCGVPDIDTDNDQIPDCLDECPEFNLAIGAPCDDGDPNTGNDHVTENCLCEGSQIASQIDGLVEWNRICGSREITLEFYEPGTNILVYEFDGIIDLSGYYSVTDLAPGVYDIYFKVDGFLARGINSFEAQPGVNELYVGAIISGDINGDNVVSIVDFSIMISLFGVVNYNNSHSKISDINCDGIINIVDLSTLITGFGTGGDSPE